MEGKKAILRKAFLLTANRECQRDTVQASFDHDVEAVFKALTDPEFLVDRNLAIGEISAEYNKKEDEGTTTLHAVRQVRRTLPGVLAKLFDPVNVMDMTENWQADGDGWSGDWTLDICDQPVIITGQFNLVPPASVLSND